MTQRVRSSAHDIRWLLPPKSQVESLLAMYMQRFRWLLPPKLSMRIGTQQTGSPGRRHRREAGRRYDHPHQQEWRLHPTSGCFILTSMQDFMEPCLRPHQASSDNNNKQTSMHATYNKTITHAPQEMKC